MAKAKILGFLLTMLGLLFIAGQAQAQNPPPPECNAGPINYNGDVNIAPPGGGNNDCIINGDVTATGYIRINAPLGKIQVTGNINASNHGNVILSAGSTIEVGGSIVVNNASAPLGQAGSVDIKANMAGSGPAFVIGGASSNGVAGTINTDTSLGGGNDPFFIRGGIRIRNRNDITLTSATALSVKATASRSGVIILEAVDGNLSLPTGTLSADGQTGQSAGAIVLQAHTITTQDGTIVSASDSVGQASHFVNIAASSVSFQGSTGLTIRANGGGSTANGTGSFAYALPEFGIFVTDDSTTNPQNFTWTVTYPFGTAYPGGLTWNGAVGSPLNFTANGTSHTQVLMTGYPLVFNGGDLLLAARGQEDHRIDLTYTGSTSGINGLVVNANKLTLNANANVNAGLGGDIFVSIPRPTSASPQQVLFTADGPASASANGGTVQFFPKGDVTLGGNAGQFHLSAQSGSLGGNGGRATVSNKPFTTELASNTAVQVTARGQNGDGGYLELRSLFANFNGTGLKLAADATGSGKGGELILDVDGPITVGSGFGAVNLSAEADATVGSDGGKITVISGSSADITSGQLSVKSGPTGSGGQLDLTIGGSLSLTGSLKADAGLSGNGRGGLVRVDAGDLVLNGSTTGGGQSLSADGAGMGAGGSVTAIIQASSHPTIIAGQQQGALSLSANGGKDAMGAFLGAGGVLQLTDLNEGFIITGGALDVKSGPGQNAGSILVDAGTTLAVSGDIKAVGTGNGANGGTIRLTAQSDNDIVFSGTGPTNIIADGGQNGTTTGDGGNITISNSGIGNLVFQNQVILSAAAEGTNGGNAGKVSATTAGGLVFGGAGSKIKANGRGVTGITNIKLDAAGDITIGSNTGEVELLAKGAAPGQKAGAVDITSQQGTILVDGQKVSIPPGSNGEGGSGKFKGKIITISGTLDLNGKGIGSGGNLDLEATESFALGGNIFANGGNNGGNAGTIYIHDTGSVNVGATSVIQANGVNGGLAGSIILAQTGTSQTMTLDSATLSATGNATGNTTSNEISVTSAAAISMIGTTLSTDGVGTGDAGNIAINSTSFNEVNLNNGSLSASGDQISGSGKAGTIVVTNKGPISVFQTSLEAKGSASGGDAGTITLSVDTTAVPIDISATTIDASANPAFAGLGGRVEITKAKGSQGIVEIDVINVDAGSMSAINEFDGAVDINGVVCQQWKTGYTGFNSSFWDCVHPTAPEPLDLIPATVGEGFGPMKSVMTGSKTRIYFFKDDAQWNQFFRDNDPVDFGNCGTSFVSLRLAPVSSIYQSCHTPLRNLTATELGDSAGHELGHAVDFSFPQATQSHSNQYTLGVINDMLLLDYLLVDFDFKQGSIPRPPCSNNDTAPFDGVKNMNTGSFICDPNTHLVDPDFENWTNSKIAYELSGNIFHVQGTVYPDVTWDELYAEALSYRVYGRNQPDVNSLIWITAEGLFKRGWFSCANAWADNLLGGSSTGIGCSNNSIPGWYIPTDVLTP